MEDMVLFLLSVTPLAASAWFLHKRSRHRGKHPLWPALGATSVAGLLMVAGVMGYNLDALDANAAGTPWSGTVIWWEVGLGMALLPVAASCWRKGLRSFNPASASDVRMAR
jgi:hypothetical protein